MSESETFVAPQYLEKKWQIEWLENTEKYGQPVYLYPFWFWEGSDEDYDHLNQCHPFRVGVGPNEILACSVWMNKEPGEFMFGWSPVFMEDYRGPEIIDLDKLPPEERERVVTIGDVHILGSTYEAMKESEKKAASIGKYNKLLYLTVGATALGVGLRYLEAKKRKRR